VTPPYPPPSVTEPFYFLFGCRRLLRRYRRLPLTPATPLGLPSLPQRVGNVRPIEISLPGGSALERTGLFEFLTPAGEQLFAFLLAERVVLEEITPLAGVTLAFPAHHGGLRRLA